MRPPCIDERTGEAGDGRGCSRPQEDRGDCGKHVWLPSSCIFRAATPVDSLWKTCGKHPNRIFVPHSFQLRLCSLYVPDVKRHISLGP